MAKQLELGRSANSAEMVNRLRFARNVVEGE